ncbi:hypothetical protein [Paenibacillus sp. BK720]|uniref:hypothetical protein n=1 Tax=Paenibacillus sp. BK720 TaxID=2587092 RepID=UPI0014230866|nr:hypothetical protein [Paenibacillus sp. BK720]NIK69947.1 hypothetical protein [Paenibacillus sp. BK720]
MARKLIPIGAAEAGSMLDVVDAHPAGRHNEIPFPANMNDFAMHAEIRIGTD